MPRLAHTTDYPDLELVYVDNASSDGSVEFVREHDLPFPLAVVENDRNLSFSDACNDGAERARHDLLLFLNNDIEPFDPWWLQELVACLETSGSAAAGATLLHAAYERAYGKPTYVLQHRGIELARQGFVVPVASDDGRLLAAFDGADIPRLGCTAACLLVRREAFDAVAGFTSGFLFGWEDVDLGLKLTAAGERVVCSGRSVLFHHESSTRLREMPLWRRQNYDVNQRLLMERWGPQLRREYMLDRLGAGGFWADAAPPRVGVVQTGHTARDLPAQELADALERDGWPVDAIGAAPKAWQPVPRGADLLVVTDPGFGASAPDGVDVVAWVREPVGDWLRAPLLRRAELVLASGPALVAPLEAAGIAAIPFPGAANPQRCAAPAGGDRPIDCLVVADHDVVTPEAVLAIEAVPAARVAVLGRGWEEPPAGVEALGEIVPERLPSLLASARVVVFETAAGDASAPETSALMLDALVAGALPLTDDGPLLEWLVGEPVPAWTSAEDLADSIGALLGDEERRRALVERWARVVLDRHTWRHRARTLMELVAARAAARRFCLKVPGVDAAAAAPLRLGLERRGHACMVRLAAEWDRLDGMTADVAVVLGPPGDCVPAPAQVNVLWTTEAPSAAECDRWDLVLRDAGGDDPAAALLHALDEAAALSGVSPHVVAQR
jgi:GT2 family glycosyltransferase